jgi:hypothetical protein
MKKILAALLFAAVAAFTFADTASAAAPPSATPKPVKTANHSAKAVPNVKPSALPGPIDPLHPPMTLLVTDIELRLVLTPFGWAYVQVPVQYYVTGVWNPVYQAYGYYDRQGRYRLYYPPVVPVPNPVPFPRPR